MYSIGEWAKTVWILFHTLTQMKELPICGKARGGIIAVH